MLKPNFLKNPIEFPEEFQQQLIQWFEENAVEYSWRKTVEPYPILVSEVMLQQTTVQAVAENKRVEKFLEEFPTLEVLAAAPEEQLLKAWEGLGYYNRVRNLQKMAKQVLAEHDGEFPQELNEIEKLAGVGRYTAAAVYSFAYNRSAALVDANVYRVFARLFNDDRSIKEKAVIDEMWQRAAQLVSPEQARKYNGAIMELGQTVCRQKEVHCMECPVHAFCQTKDPLALPNKGAKVEKIEKRENGILSIMGEKILLVKPQEGRRKGFYHLPLRETEEVQELVKLGVKKYGITKYKVTLHLYEQKEEEPREGEIWVSIADLETIPIASPVRKALEHFLPLVL